ncbi:MAG: FAD-dependent oxidoreductase [Chloroflexota bacterium]
MIKQADAVIIGAGIIGCAVAFELAKKGVKTVNIDKLPTAGFGPTSNSCAIIRAHYSTFEGTAFAYDNFWYWQNWRDYLEADDELGYATYHDTGTIWIPNQVQGYKHIVELYEQVGVAYEIWEPETLRQKMPLFDTNSHWPPRRPENDDFWDESGEGLELAIFTPGSGYVSDPQLASHNLMRAAEARGGQFLFNQEVAAIRQTNNRVEGVTLSDGSHIDAPIVVNVAGPHSGVINRMAGVEAGMKVKTRPLRHEVHHVPSPASFNYETDGIHVSDGDASVYFRPEVGNAILVGSEDPECDVKEWVDDPDVFNRTLTTDQWKAQVYRLAKRIPDLPIPEKPSGVVDLYDVSDDWIPIYDKSSLDGFYMAIGSSGNQFKNAAGAGYLLAEIISMAGNGQDHDLDPLQHKLPNIGVTIDASCFSRLREINPNSSFSVLG